MPQPRWCPTIGSSRRWPSSSRSRMCCRRMWGWRCTSASGAQTGATEVGGKGPYTAAVVPRVWQHWRAAWSCTDGAVLLFSSTSCGADTPARLAAGCPPLLRRVCEQRAPVRRAAAELARAAGPAAGAAGAGLCAGGLARRRRAMCTNARSSRSPGGEQFVQSWLPPARWFAGRCLLPREASPPEPHPNPNPNPSLLRRFACPPCNPDRGECGAAGGAGAEGGRQAGGQGGVCEMRGPGEPRAAAGVRSSCAAAVPLCGHAEACSSARVRPNRRERRGSAGSSQQWQSSKCCLIEPAKLEQETLNHWTAHALPCPPGRTCSTSCRALAACRQWAATSCW